MGNKPLIETRKENKVGILDYCGLSKKLLNTLTDVLSQVECGHDNDHLIEEEEGILLAYGEKNITFKTDFKPERVYVSITCDGLAVCVGEKNTIGVTLLEDGFILHASVKTNHALVKWIIKKSTY